MRCTVYNWGKVKKMNEQDASEKHRKKRVENTGGITQKIESVWVACYLIHNAVSALAAIGGGNKKRGVSAPL